MISKYPAILIACLLLLLLTGCGTSSIPTGLSENKYLHPDGKMIAATTLAGTTFNSDDQRVELDIDQIRLAQLHSVPQYMRHSDLGLAFFLLESKAKPSDSFKWEPIAISGYSVNVVLKELTLISPQGAQFEVPVRLESGKARLDLDAVIQKLRPNVEYTLSCPRCNPDLSRLRGQYLELPTPPRVTTEISFKLNSAEYGAITRRVQQEKAAAARKQRERELAERKRQQQLAQEKREREAQARKIEADRKREAARIAREGDGSPDDLVCKKYGFKPNSDAYASCRLQIDVAKREMQQQRAMYLDQQRRIQEAEEAERRRRQSAFMMGMGLRMMGGQSAAGAAVDQSVGAPMYQPPPPTSRTYTLPNGRMMTCTTTGSMTNCF